MGLNFADMNGFVKTHSRASGNYHGRSLRTAPDLQKPVGRVPRWTENLGVLQNVLKEVSVMFPGPCDGRSWFPQMNSPFIPHLAMQRMIAIITQFSAKPIEAWSVQNGLSGLKNLTILVRTLEVIEKHRGKKLISIPFLSMIKTRFNSCQRTNNRRVPIRVRWDETLSQTTGNRPIWRYYRYIAVSTRTNGWIPDYIQGKHSPKRLKYAHESLKECSKNLWNRYLSRTNSSKLLQVFAGFSLGQADILRRAIGKKIASELAAQPRKKLKGAKENGHSEKTLP